MIFADVLGYVLAGGESSRMQRSDLPQDKALLMLGGQTLLQRALTTVAAVCPHPRILCGTPERCARLGHMGTLVPDQVTFAGPLGGLQAALQDAHRRRAAWALLLPVDLPWMPSAVLRALTQRTLLCGAAAACMRSAGFVQPLPLVIRVDAELLLTGLLEAGERKLLPALHTIAKHCGSGTGLFMPDAEDLGEPAEEAALWFRNVNTPEDFQAAEQDETLQSRLHQSKHGG